MVTKNATISTFFFYFFLIKKKNLLNELPLGKILEKLNIDLPQNIIEEIKYLIDNEVSESEL
jgi:hypothetical protein